MIVVQQDIHNNLTDIPKDDEFKEDVALIENWDEDAKVPELSSEFKTARSIRIININPDEIEKALNEFDNVVNNISCGRKCRFKIRQSSKIRCYNINRR